MLNLLSFSIIFSLLSGLGSSQKEQKATPRELFSTGTFVYVGAENDALIERTKTMQIETMNGGKTKIFMKIKWLDDQTYVLTQKRVINLDGDCMSRGSKIRTVISDYTDNTYTCFFDAGKCGNGLAQIKKIKN
jgi:hypothetical protein